MGWFIAGSLLMLLLAVMLVIDIRDRSLQSRVNRHAVREGREAAHNDALLRGLDGPGNGY